MIFTVLELFKLFNVYIYFITLVTTSQTPQLLNTQINRPTITNLSSVRQFYSTRSCMTSIEYN